MGQVIWRNGRGLYCGKHGVGSCWIWLYTREPTAAAASAAAATATTTTTTNNNNNSDNNNNRQKDTKPFAAQRLVRRMLMHVAFPRRQLPKALLSVHNVTTTRADIRASK